MYKNIFNGSDEARSKKDKGGTKSKGKTWGVREKPGVFIVQGVCEKWRQEHNRRSEIRSVLSSISVQGD